MHLNQGRVSGVKCTSKRVIVARPVLWPPIVAAPKPRPRPPLSDAVKIQHARLKALIGKAIVFSQHYRRGKRHVPSTRLEIVSVKREKESFAISFIGVNAAAIVESRDDSLGYAVL